MTYRIVAVLIALFVFALPLQAQDVEVDDIVFARDVSTAYVIPVQPDEIFPSTLTTIYTVISGEGLEEGDELDIVWIYEGDELDTLVYTAPEDLDEFSIWASWTDDNGLQAGDWEVEVYYDGDRLDDAEFEITDDEYIFPIRFGEECGRSTGILIGEDDEFEEVTHIFAYVEYANFDEQTVEIYWSVDGDIIDMDVLTPVFDGEGYYCFFLNYGGDIMPDGDYGFMVLDEDGDELAESDEVEVSD